MPLGWLGPKWSWPPIPQRTCRSARCLPAVRRRRPGPPARKRSSPILDSARRQLGLGPYDLPSNFTSLAPARQLLVLTNLDRLAYGLAPVAGLNAELDESALEGVEQLSDPLPPVELLPGNAVWGFTSNWAGNFPNAPAAYYDWMYDDGYGSANAACTSPSAPTAAGDIARMSCGRFPKAGWRWGRRRDRRVRHAGLCDGDRLHARLAVARLLLHLGPTATVASASKRALEPLRGAPFAARRAGRRGLTAPRQARGSQARDAKTAPGPRARGNKAASAPHPGACSDAPASG